MFQLGFKISLRSLEWQSSVTLYIAACFVILVIFKGLLRTVNKFTAFRFRLDLIKFIIENESNILISNIISLTVQPVCILLLESSGPG